MLRTIAGCCPGYFWELHEDTCERKSEVRIKLYITTPITNEPISNLHLQKQFYLKITSHIPECMSGYSGIYCTTVCPYPTCGYRCQGICDCDEDMRDVSNECEPITSGK